MTTSIVLCKGHNCPMKYLCLRYLVIEDPFFQPWDDYEFDANNRWCEHYITIKGGDTEDGKERER